MIRHKVLACLVLLLTAATACSSASGQNEDGSPAEVHITIGTGLPYAPLTVIRQNRVLETAFPKTEIVWDEGVSGGAATRDGILSGKVQVGVTGIAPFLVGVDKGVPWKVLGSMGQIGISLVSRDPNIRTLADLNASGRPISVPSPDSGQAMALKSLAQSKLGDVKAFDDQLSPMPHPDAYQALLTGTTGAAFITPPFQYQLLADPEAHEIATAADAFGSITYSAIVMSDKFHDDNPVFAETLFTALSDSLRILREDPEAAAEVLSSADAGRQSAASYAEWLQLPQNHWDVTPRGFVAHAEFMKTVGLTKSVPSTEQMMFPSVSGAGQ
ncbi:ABC transporter substrate-binding protein [Rhodococcus sp. NPDC056743]|uniref:ABC transporter substrate-binding protein n=1 Tax=Rhodococcus sp. NPDC056743 TaxID=3345934 RepID=UPI00367208E8